MKLSVSAPLPPPRVPFADLSATRQTIGEMEEIAGGNKKQGGEEKLDAEEKGRGKNTITVDSTVEDLRLAAHRRLPLSASASIRKNERMA